MAAAFLPGRVADSHVTAVAKHLVSVVGSVSEKAGLMSSPVARLTGELGETWRDVVQFYFGFHFFNSLSQQNVIELSGRSVFFKATVVVLSRLGNKSESHGLIPVQFGSMRSLGL